ncbi:MAG: hypothetical protein R3C25_12660 [Hyphomonadaceae bacterium]
MRVLARLLFIAAFAGIAAPGPAFASGEQRAPATRQERLTSAESYVPMPTLAASVIQRYTTSGTLVVDMGLDIPDAALRRRAQLNGPRLRDALRTALSTYASTFYRDRTPPNPTELTRQLQLAVDHTLGASGARVLLANIIYQRQQ